MSWNEYKGTYAGVDHVRARDDWADALESWCRYLEAIGRTRETIRTRWYQISRFSRMVGKPIDQVTSMDVVDAVSSARLGLSARKGLRAAIQGFYQWAIEIDGSYGVRTNPAKAVPPMPDSPGGGLICPEDALARAVTHPEPRVRVVCMLAGWLGLRRIEISRLQLTDMEIRGSETILHVNGKGRRQRDLPVPMRLRIEIQSLAADQGDCAYLIPGRRHPQCSVDYVDTLIKRGSGWPPHTLRRRFATVAYANSHDILAVARLLGHASAKTTMRYIGLIDADMAAIVESTAGPWHTVHGTPLPMYSGWASLSHATRGGASDDFRTSFGQPAASMSHTTQTFGM